MSENTSVKGRETTRLVLAAGAVLFRLDGGRPVCAVVHRPRYDDWSLPKGKVDPGESLPVTAVRELAEETGFTSVLGRRIGTTGYPLKEGVRKEVTYWSAHAGPGSFTPNDEVDELRWLPVDEARELLTYPLDRRILERFHTGHPPTSVLALVRHARAGKRSEWTGDDDLRPLDKNGRIQAEMLAPMLRAFGVTRVHAAPLVRCEQTVTPLAEELGTRVRPVPQLSDAAHGDDPVAALETLVDLAAGSTTAAVCSQGTAIPDLVARLAAEADLDVADTATKKAGTWVLGFDGRRPVFADYYPSPLPVR